MQETWVWSLGQEDPLEKGMATHSNILAWRIPWAEEPGGLQSTGSQRVGHHWATSLSLSQWITEYYEHNFYMPGETKKSMWLTLLWYLLYCDDLELLPQYLLVYLPRKIEWWKKFFSLRHSTGLSNSAYYVRLNTKLALICILSFWRFEWWMRGRVVYAHELYYDTRQTVNKLGVFSLCTEIPFCGLERLLFISICSPKFESYVHPFIRS